MGMAIERLIAWPRKLMGDAENLAKTVSRTAPRRRCETHRRDEAIIRQNENPARALRRLNRAGSREPSCASWRATVEGSTWERNTMGAPKVPHWKSQRHSCLEVS